MDSQPYLYPNSAQTATARLQALEAIEDPGTWAALDAVGDIRGARCLEVGAGAGSVARWLASKIGNEGHLTVTDIEPVLLQPLVSPVVAVWRHDVSRDPLPKRAFDLVHIRHVLFHLGRGVEASLDSLCAAVAPGGHLLIEESDFADAGSLSSTPAHLRDAYDSGLAAMLALYRMRGLDVRLGHSVAGMLAARGFHLRSVNHEQRVVRGGDAEALFHRDTVLRIASAIEQAGIGSSHTVAAMLEALGDDHLQYRTRQTVRVLAHSYVAF